MDFFKFDEIIKEKSKSAEIACAGAFKRAEEISEYNQQKVLNAFIENKVGESMFSGSTGYGYGDVGREALDKTYARIFAAEDALVRHNFTCGTHTLAVALFGVLRPGDKMLCISGEPYDTIQPVIGIKGKPGDGSLKDFGVEYSQVSLNAGGRLDYDAIAAAVKKENPSLVYIQRSRGYSLRPSISCDEIERAVKTVRKYSSAPVMVDNCYGEFVEKREPLEAGADLIAGSLIKNPGGAIARTGGYIAGRADLVEKCAYRLTTPGIGKEIGATLGQSRDMFMGLFAAPHVVEQAIKTAVFASALFESFGFSVSPGVNEHRCDIVQTICLEKAENLVEFCRGLQSGAPIDSYVAPEPWDMPGYEDKVIMAAGAFTNGSSIELSADGPLREPFAAWMQGGVNYYSGKAGVMLAAENMLKKGLIK